jgi:hypothetical protein
MELISGGVNGINPKSIPLPSNALTGTIQNSMVAINKVMNIFL